MGSALSTALSSAVVSGGGEGLGIGIDSHSRGDLERAWSSDLSCAMGSALRSA
jgi:hypothetical protein